MKIGNMLQETLSARNRVPKDLAFSLTNEGIDYL